MIQAIGHRDTPGYDWWMGHERVSNLSLDEKVLAILSGLRFKPREIIGGVLLRMEEIFGDEQNIGFTFLHNNERTFGIFSQGLDKAIEYLQNDSTKQIAVRLYAQDIRHPDFLDLLRERIKTIAQNNLVLEIQGEDLGSIDAGCLNNLKVAVYELGVAFAICDTTIGFEGIGEGETTVEKLIQSEGLMPRYLHLPENSFHRIRQNLQHMRNHGSALDLPMPILRFILSVIKKSVQNLIPLIETRKIQIPDISTQGTILYTKARREGMYGLDKSSPYARELLFQVGEEPHWEIDGGILAELLQMGYSTALLGQMLYHAGKDVQDLKYRMERRSVNALMRDLSIPFDTLQKVFHRAGIDGYDNEKKGLKERITIEITEPPGSITSNTIRNLRDLIKKEKYGLALDDIGGKDTIARTKDRLGILNESRIPLDMLKIDGMICEGINAKGMSLPHEVNTIIAEQLKRNPQLTIVTESVQNMEHAAVLEATILGGLGNPNIHIWHQGRNLDKKVT